MELNPAERLALEIGLHEEEERRALQGELAVLQAAWKEAEAIARIAKSGVTILVVEQNTRIALATSQRAYVLRTGEIALEGASRELATNPEIQAAYLGG